MPAGLIAVRSLLGRAAEENACSTGLYPKSRTVFLHHFKPASNILPLSVIFSI
jgi:hypothetical protein